MQADLIEEPLVARGMAATLALLNQKGVSTRLNDEELDKERRLREREKWMAEMRQAESKESADPRKQGRLIEERFKNYTPNVQLQYTDEFGRNLTPKEVSLFSD